MITRTWPYGTKKEVTVIQSHWKVLVVEDGHEGYALLDHGLKPVPKQGAKGVITFTQGGPTGGYWKFEK